MRVGFALGNIGPIGTAENLVKIAQRAEALAYDSLWTVERLLWPVAPQTPYAATADGSLPEAYKRVLDPLDALTFVAAHTKKIALGTSVLDIPYHNPAMLARRGTTLDGLADGWNPVAIPVDGMQKMFEGLKQMAKAAGRDPSKLQLVVRANAEVGSKPRPKDGPIFTGTLEQVKEDIEGCRRIGAHELHFDPTFMPGAQKLDRWLGLM